MPDRIMFVDDEPNVLKSLRWLFAGESYRFYGVESPLKALSIMEKQPVAVVVADQRMHEMTGTVFLEQVRRNHPDTVRIMATAYADTAVTVSAINRVNVYRFLFKPWDEKELKQTICNAVEHHRLISENRRLVGLLRSQNAELMAINRDLEKTVALRTDKIEKAAADRRRLEAKLVQVQKMEAIGTFAGGIAHDFNNILSAVMGYTELAKLHVESDSRAAAYLTQLERAQQRAKELVQQILTFSSHNPSAQSPLALKAAITETLKLLRSIMPATITVQQDITDCGSVYASETQIHQVVMNLCTNAFHAMEDDGGVLNVALSEMWVAPETTAKALGLASGAYARIVVADTGPGIDPRIVDRIFEPYFTTKQSGKGTGLGLSVAHGIVKNLGGTIVAENGKAGGAVFAVYLPLLKCGDPVADVAGAPARGGSERILFVDDEPSLADIGRQILESLGYDVIALTDSRAALALFRADPHRFDLAITDMTMPKMTGDKLAGALMDIRSDIPIIICSGFSEKLTEETAAAMGIRAYATKPLSRRHLARTIRQVLDG